MKKQKQYITLLIVILAIFIFSIKPSSAVADAYEKYYYKGYNYATGIGELNFNPNGTIQENNAATIAVSSSVVYDGFSGKARIKTYTRNGIVQQWYSRNYKMPGDIRATQVTNSKIVTTFKSQSAVDNFIAPSNILPKESSKVAIPGLGWLADGLSIPYLGGIIDTALFLINESSGGVKHNIDGLNKSASIYLTSVSKDKTEIPPSVGVANADKYTAGVYDPATGTYKAGYKPKSIGAVSNFLFHYDVPEGVTRNLQASAKAYYTVFTTNDISYYYPVDVYTRQATHYFTITGRK
ncbi:hypothetical protein [Paenibacillus sp. 453mf]|uniref:hypothetical protein n=1 Tax=Paenibacillus sp. 453mf TaxID=1761874 RepID=UPI0008E5BADC|nr:hypothetical protein [Paenibacillus sp. 453mf]SFS47734.1 hypothetical protein SAMN04488601_101945 [Paenibacillus sp. 453mf]